MTEQPDAYEQPDERPGRNPTNWLLGGVIVVLAIIAVLVGVLVLRDDSDEPVAASTTVPMTSTTAAGQPPTTTLAPTPTTVPIGTTAPETTTTTAAVTTTVPVTTTIPVTATTTIADTTTTAPPTPSPEPGEAEATAAAVAWIEAISAGDVAAAYALLDPASQLAAGGDEGFADLLTALQEGFGAWAGAVDSTVFVNEVDEDLWVVTIVAEVTREGITEVAGAAVPVAAADDEYLVAAFRGDEPVEFEAPTPGASFAAGGTFQFVVPNGTTVQAFADDAATGPLTITTLDENTSRITAQPQAPLGSGTHVLTVVYRDGDVLHADAIVFSV